MLTRSSWAFTNFRASMWMNHMAVLVLCLLLYKSNEHRFKVVVKQVIILFIDTPNDKIIYGGSSSTHKFCIILRLKDFLLCSIFPILHPGPTLHVPFPDWFLILHHWPLPLLDWFQPIRNWTLPFREISRLVRRGAFIGFYFF